MCFINTARVALIARGRIASAIFGTFVLLAFIPVSASAGSRLNVSGNGVLENDYGSIDFTGVQNVFTSFGSGPGPSINSQIVNSRDDRLGYGTTIQAAIVFNLSSLHAPVQSAILSLYVSGAWAGASSYGANSPNSYQESIFFSMIQFAGSGQVKQSDFNVSSYPAAGIFDPSVNFSSFIYPVNLDFTSFINGLIKNGDQYAEFVLSSEEPITNSGPVTFDFAGQSFLQPTLSINAPAPYSGPIPVGISSVPEPSSYLMLTLGAVAVAGSRGARRRRRSPSRAR